MNNRAEFASDSEVISHGFERVCSFIFFFFVLLQRILLNEAWNKSKEENHRLRDTLKRFNHLGPLRACFHDATLVRDPLCYLQKCWCFWVADSNSLKTRQQLKDSTWCDMPVQLFIFWGLRVQGWGRKEAVKYFCQFFINVSKAEDSLNSVVESPWTSTVTKTESLLPYTSQE